MNLSTRAVSWLMVLATVFWSGAFVTGKYAVREFPPFALTFFRFTVALPFVFAILRLRQPDRWIPTRKQWPALIWLGVLGMFLYHALFFSALRETTAINSSLIGSSLPIVTAVVAALFFGERISALQVAGICLSFLGVCLTVTGGSLSAVATSGVNRGDLLMLLAVFAWAFFMATSRKYMPLLEISPLMLTAWTFLICMLVSLPLAITENPSRFLPLTTWKGWGSVFYMAILSSVVGYLIQMVAIERLGTATAAIFVNLVPVFTILQAAYFLGEPITGVKVVSAAIIISGVLIATQLGRRPARADA